MKKGFVVAIDGPAGSGKSTVARMLAEELGYVYVDTGAMYRALTFKTLRGGIDLNSKKALIELARGTNVKLESANGRSLRVLLDEEDVTERIREPEVTNNVAYLANIPEIRELMVSLQRTLGEGRDIVIEGRDTTTVVFPNADKKFYLDASFEERLSRRHQQLLSEGKGVVLDILGRDMNARDKKDTGRRVGALRRAEDAIYIDTTKLTIVQVVKKITSYIK
ncbi:MAG: (d)CMP kinase [Candidatus Omnitrophica bacterium]|nr:(d)CMP kinase [Candidatus Omnitrophota bacterium]